MAESSVVVLPPLFGGQAESWAALVELAPAFGDNWLLIGALLGGAAGVVPLMAGTCGGDVEPQGFAAALVGTIVAVD